MQAQPIRIAPTLDARPAGPEYAEALADLVRRNVEHLRSFVPAVTALDSFEKAREHLDGVAGRAERDEILEWYLFADDVMCGAVRLNKIEVANRKASVSYLLDAAHQGRGIATRAVQALVEHCFTVLNLNRLELTCATTNLPSARLAERVGFVREGLLRQAECLNGAFVDHFVYGLIRSEFSISP